MKLRCTLGFRRADPFGSEIHVYAMRMGLSALIGLAAWVSNSLDRGRIELQFLLSPFHTEDPILKVAMCFIVGSGAATWTSLGPVRWGAKTLASRL
jgi:hypothetical protein